MVFTYAKLKLHLLFIEKKNNLYKVIKGLIFDLDGVIVNTDVYRLKHGNMLLVNILFI